MTTKCYAVDLDGTLAHYDGWKGPDHIGDPIPMMLDKVKGWLDKGIVVKIFTARADDPTTIPPIKKWLKKVGLPDLEITNKKDQTMERFYDDRAVRVKKNTGQTIGENMIVNEYLIRLQGD